MPFYILSKLRSHTKKEAANKIRKNTYTILIIKCLCAFEYQLDLNSGRSKVI